MLPHPHAYTSNALAFDPFASIPPSSQSQPQARRSTTVGPSLPRPPANAHIPRRAPPPGPTVNHLDYPYAPPSSSQHPRATPQHKFRADLEGKEDPFSRPNSSLSRPAGEYLPSTYRPTMISEALVDRYRPPPPPPSLPSGSQRSAVEVYQASREPKAAKASKAPEILANIASLQIWLEEAFQRKGDEEKEFREGLLDRLRALDEENKDLKERLHELQMGQKILPTREELNEAITSQLSPALHEFFQSHHHTLRKTIEPLSHDIPRQTTEKVKSIMLEMQDTARREVLRDHEVQNPLIGLMSHLVGALTPLNHVVKVLDNETLGAIRALPAALEDVAVFKITMEEFKQKSAEHPKHAPPSSSTETAALQSVLRDLAKKMESLEARVGRQPCHPMSPSPIESPRLVGPIRHASQARVPRCLESDQAAADSIAQESDRVAGGHLSTSNAVQTRRSHATSRSNPTGEAGGLSIPPQNVGTMSRSASTPRQSRPETEFVLPTPVTEAPHVVQRLVSAAGRGDSQAPTPPPSSEGQQRAQITLATMSAEPVPLDQRVPEAKAPVGMMDTSMLTEGPAHDEPATFTAGLLFPESALPPAPTRSVRPPTTYSKSKSHKRKRFPAVPTSLALADADGTNAQSTRPTMTSLVTSLQSDEDIVDPMITAATTPAQKDSGVLPSPANAIETSESSGSSTVKRRKANTNSIEVKRERLNDIYGTAQHNTRAKVSQAKEIGIDVHGDIELQSVSRSTTATSGGSSRSKPGSQKQKSNFKRDSKGRFGSKTPVLVDNQAPALPAMPEATSLPLPTATAAVEPSQQAAIPESVVSIPPANDESVEYIETDIGHGQPLSAPSLPHPWSTANKYETQGTTIDTLPAIIAEQKQSTSTDRVDQSPSLALAPNDAHAPRQPLRRQPSYRKNQVLLSQTAHEAKMADWKRNFGAYDQSDDDDD